MASKQDILEAEEQLLEQGRILLDIASRLDEEDAEIEHLGLVILEQGNVALQNTDESPVWGGSAPGKARNKARDFAEAYKRVVKNYFSGIQSKFDKKDFERRFRMPRHVFMRIQQTIIGQPPFIHKEDALGKPGIHPLVRLVACLRKLAYGTADDSLDENFSNNRITSGIRKSNGSLLTLVTIKSFAADHGYIEEQWDATVQ